MGDSLYFIHAGNFASDNEDGSSHTVKATIFEAQSFGLSIKNNVPKLTIKPVSSGLLLLIPFRTGETTILVKTKIETSCYFCLNGLLYLMDTQIISYEYTKIVILPKE